MQITDWRCLCCWCASPLEQYFTPRVKQSICFRMMKEYGEISIQKGSELYIVQKMRL